MTSVPSRLAGLVAATLVAATGLVGLASPASAAMCSTSGISAVADYNDGAGGGIGTACDRTTGSRTAAVAFEKAGYTVRRDTQGAVCQVNNRPSKPNCGRLGAEYWSLWWSDGKGGWSYSQQGDRSLTVPRNGSVAWVWQGPSGRRQPGVAPARVSSSSPKPTPRPTPRGTTGTKPATPPTKSTGGQDSGSAPAAAPSRASRPAGAANTDPPTSGTARAKAKPKPSAKASPSARSSPSASASPSTSSTPEPTEDTSPAAASVQEADGTFAPVEQPSGLPTWVPIGVIVVLGSVATGTVWWRNRSSA